MPEVAQAAPVKAEALEAFLKAQERPSADLRGNADPTRALPHNALNFLPEQAKDERRFVRTDAGEAVAPLAVQAMRFPQASD